MIAATRFSLVNPLIVARGTPFPTQSFVLPARYPAARDRYLPVLVAVCPGNSPANPSNSPGGECSPRDALPTGTGSAPAVDDRLPGNSTEARRQRCQPRRRQRGEVPRPTVPAARQAPRLTIRSDHPAATTARPDRDTAGPRSASDRIGVPSCAAGPVWMAVPCGGPTCRPRGTSPARRRSFRQPRSAAPWWPGRRAARIGHRRSPARCRCRTAGRRSSRYRC